MLGIALHYGLTLEALQAANPKVNPNFLSVGTELVIPNFPGQQTSHGDPQPYPAAFINRRAALLPCREGTGAWCVAQVSNDQSYAVDNLQVWFSLADSSGTVVTRTQVTPSLDWIPAGDTLPLLAFFSAGRLPVGDPGTGMPVQPYRMPTRCLREGGRYLPLRAQVSQVQIGPDRLQAVVQGTDRLSATSSAGGYRQRSAVHCHHNFDSYSRPCTDQIKANVIWLLAVAYDAHGKVVGARRWEADKGLKPSGSMNFTVTVYSLGPPIDHVEVVLEARNQ